MLAPRGRAVVGEGGIFAGRRVAEVAEQVHRLVVAEDDDDTAARARGLRLEFLKTADDEERVRLAVGDVAELDQRRLAARPVPGGIDQPRGPGDRLPRLEVAVEVTDRDDAVRLRGIGRGDEEAKSASATSAMRINRSSGDRALTAPIASACRTGARARAMPLIALGEREF